MDGIIETKGPVNFHEQNIPLNLCWCSKGMRKETEESLLRIVSAILLAWNWFHLESNISHLSECQTSKGKGNGFGIILIALGIFVTPRWACSHSDALIFISLRQIFGSLLGMEK